MAQRFIWQDGSFSTDIRDAINDNFEELYAGRVTVFSNGATPGAYTAATAGLVMNDAAGNEIWRLWGSDPVEDAVGFGNYYWGYQAGLAQSVDGGNTNVGIGWQALTAITTGRANVGIGYDALWANTTGAGNVVIGSAAHWRGVTLSNDTAIGSTALANSYLTTGAGGGYCSVLGSEAASRITQATAVIAIGYRAAKARVGTTASYFATNGIFIGNSVNALADDATDETVIGHNMDGRGSNTVAIGNSSNLDNWFYGNIHTTKYIESFEMTAPAAPAANGGRLYFEDNGSGKTRLMCLFATGAAQQVTIEP